MIEFEGWKNEIIDSIKELHDETKLIRKYLEGEQDDQEDQHDPEQDDQEDQHDPEQDDQEDQHDPEQNNKEDQYEQEEQEAQDVQEVIIQKLDDINDSINILNKTVVESSIVVSISIIIALAFHYFVSQLSKW